MRPSHHRSEGTALSDSSSEHGSEGMIRKGTVRIRAKNYFGGRDSNEEHEGQKYPHKQGIARISPLRTLNDLEPNATLNPGPLSAVRLDNQHGRTRSGAYLPRRDRDPPPAKYFRIAYPPRLPQPMGDFLEIFQTAEHGRGVRTTCDNIPQGTVLYTEHAALRAPSFLKDHEDELTKRIRGKVAALTADQRAAFISLSHADGPDTEETRFARNCFEDRDLALFDAMAPGLDASPEEIEGIYTVWLRIAMVNHSCRPNAIMLIRDAELAVADLIATVDLPVKGTELTISYLRGAEVGTEELLTKERQQLLWNGWKFKCSCPACASVQPIVHDVSNLSFGHNTNGRNLSFSSAGYETSDDRLQYMHKLGQDLGLMADLNGHPSPLLVSNFDKLFSQYENLLEEERMVYPLYHAHQKAIEVYTLHFTDTSNDELTYARILYHRERLNKYSRICYGNEEAQKSASRYSKELKGEINRPRTAKDDVHVLGSAKRSKLPMKATSSHVLKLGTQRYPIEIEESGDDSESAAPQPRTQSQKTTGPPSADEARPDKRTGTKSHRVANESRNLSAAPLERDRPFPEPPSPPTTAQPKSAERDTRSEEACGRARHTDTPVLVRPSNMALPKIRLKPLCGNGEDASNKRHAVDGGKRAPKRLRQAGPNVPSKGANGGCKRRVSTQMEDHLLGVLERRVSEVVILYHGTGSSRDDPIHLD